jgi:hypothetical protein
MAHKILSQQSKLAIDDEVWVMALDEADVFGLLLSPKAYIDSAHIQANIRPNALDVVIAIEYYDRANPPFEFANQFPYLLQGIDKTDVLTLMIPYNSARWATFLTEANPRADKNTFTNTSINENWDIFRQDPPVNNSDDNVTVLSAGGLGKLNFVHITRINGNNFEIPIFDIIKEPLGFFATINTWDKYEYINNTKQIIQNPILFFPSSPDIFRVILHIPIFGWGKRKICCKAHGCVCPGPDGTIRTLICAPNAD